MTKTPIKPNKNSVFSKKSHAQKLTRKQTSSSENTCQSVYAIGDVHGALSLLRHVLSLIKEDAENLRAIRPRIILLGDVIDRGPDSKGVIDLLMSSEFNGAFDASILLGNHEDSLLKILEGDKDLFTRWLHWGGAETVESYGVEFGRDSIDGVFRKFLKTFPRAHRDFLKTFPVFLQHENSFFVHAGVRPGITLHQQDRDDMLWIFKEFLHSEEDFGATIVHGHAVTESGEIEVLPNRIALDTGSGYKKGKLSAARIERSVVVKTFYSA